MKNHKIFSSIFGITILGFGIWSVREWRSILVLVTLGVILAGLYYLITGIIAKKTKNSSQLIPLILLLLVPTFLFIRILENLADFRGISGIIGGILTSFGTGIIIYSLLWQDALAISRENKEINIVHVLTMGTVITLILVAIFVLIVWR